MPEPRHFQINASLRRIGLIGRYTLGEALRLRLTFLLGMVSVGLVLGAWGLREFNFGSAELKFLGDFGLGAIGLMGLLLAALAMAHLFFSGIAGGEICWVLTRPVRRAEYIWGKFIGVAALLALFTAALGLLLAGLILWRSNQIGGVNPAVPVLLRAVAVIWLKVTLVAALTALVSSYAGSALFASCAGLLLALLGHLTPLIADGSRLAWLRIWPDLARFDAEALWAAGESPPGSVLLGLGCYWTGYVIILGSLASFAFKRREF